MKYLMMVLVTFSVISCDSLFDVNDDPNNPLTANPEQLLPVAQAAMASAFGDDYNFVSSMWGQYWTSGQTIALTPIENFTLTGANIRDAFNQAYARSLQDLSILIRSDNTYYSGIAKVMTAYIYQVLVDLHGDVPFSEALLGAIEDGSIVAPNYDDDQAIYDALIPLLDEAITELETFNAGGILAEPGSEDLLYSGDLGKWVTFANTLKLRVLVRQSQVDATKLQAAVDLMNSGVSFISNAGDQAEVYFDGSTNATSNPTYARFESRTATGMYMRASQTSIDFLKSTNDPRIEGIYDEGDTGFEGYEQGESQTNYAGQADNNFAEPNETYIYAPGANFIMLSAWESKFLQAEVMARANNGGEALWLEGINLSMDFFDIPSGPGSSREVYLNLLDAYGASMDDKLKSIALQKWVSFNGTQFIEGWIETRRFDVESTNTIIFRGNGGIFHRPSGSSLAVDVFPSRFMYSSTEEDLNPNVPSLTVTDKVFWDN